MGQAENIENNFSIIGLAQLNPQAGSIESNAKKVIQSIKKAEEIGVKILIFPELFLLGYPLQDTISRHRVLANDCVKWVNEIAKYSTKTVTLLGFLEPTNNNSTYYNSIAVMQNGKISQIIRKTEIPITTGFNDNKYFKKSTEFNNIIEINNKKYGLTICEDLLSNNLMKNFKNEKLEAIINCCALPQNKNEKISILKEKAKEHQCPIIHINQVGAIDNFNFAGESRVYNSKGELIARAKSYEEELFVIKSLKSIGEINEKPENYEEVENTFSLNYEKDLERTYKTLIQGIKNYFTKAGFKRAVLGLSGGLDSTICAVLLADALGSENVFGISMPSKLTSNESKSDAEELANNLKINFAEAPIKEMVETTDKNFQALFSKVENSWDNRYKQSFTMDNIQARSRAMYLWGVSNEFGSCLTIATSDKSELYMGYATINGDMSGGFAPIADITKTKLFALARWMNKNRKIKNAIPEAIILKKPGAELAIDPNTGKTLNAEDALMPYEFLDEIIWRLEYKNEQYSDMINSKFLYEKAHNISHEQKTQWLDKFYRRMSTALYKWTLLPPSIIVNKHSINSFDYTQPITSSKINYKGLSEEEIRTKIETFVKEC